jgi:hypothetical protein
MRRFVKGWVGRRSWLGEDICLVARFCPGGILWLNEFMRTLSLLLSKCVTWIVSLDLDNH